MWTQRTDVPRRGRHRIHGIVGRNGRWFTAMYNRSKADAPFPRVPAAALALATCAMLAVCCAGIVVASLLRGSVTDLYALSAGDFYQGNRCPTGGYDALLCPHPASRNAPLFQRDARTMLLDAPARRHDHSASLLPAGRLIDCDGVAATFADRNVTCAGRPLDECDPAPASTSLQTLRDTCAGDKRVVAVTVLAAAAEAGTTCAALLAACCVYRDTGAVRALSVVGVVAGWTLLAVLFTFARADVEFPLVALTSGPPCTSLSIAPRGSPERPEPSEYCEALHGVAGLAPGTGEAWCVELTRTQAAGYWDPQWCARPHNATTSASESGAGGGNATTVLACVGPYCAPEIDPLATAFLERLHTALVWAAWTAVLPAVAAALLPTVAALAARVAAAGPQADGRFDDVEGGGDDDDSGDEGRGLTAGRGAYGTSSVQLGRLT
uniref:Uncharacterized protein n=1 Tax=Bicosoecida sp. CB-2014 TaxID=1486930 RepID=A0A7S1CKU2_9STRA|mmetsp:Transcript_28429/g.98184  ORF Transcript_28429/g.98184 Transcript_28429/m.98184 type:complete len:438 (+) Transcript_28429:165-1478(+)